MRTSYFNQLKQLSPYPISNFLDSRFVYGGKSPVIMISTLVKNPAIKTAMLAHEIGHAIHYKRNCKCFINNDQVLIELHAHRFALHFMLRYKFIGALHYCILYTKNNMSHFPRHYVVAFEQLQTEKIWDKCLKFLGL